MIDLLFPDGHIVTGVEDDPIKGIRVYLDHRSVGIHTHVEDPEAIKRVRDAWATNQTMGQHLTTRVPHEALCQNCDEETE